MSKNSMPVAANHERDTSANLASYVVGFVLSIILTLTAYFLVTRGLLAGQAALWTLGGLAAVQFTVQLLCFLHLGGESRPRWKLAVFWFMLGIVFIVVVGSIWIMNNLNYHMLPASQLKSYMHTNEGI